MAQTLKDFLELHFKLLRMDDLRMNHMEQWARFEDLLTNHDLNKTTQGWADKLLKKGSDGKFINTNGVDYQLKDLPDISELSDEDLEYLYLLFQAIYHKIADEQKHNNTYAGNASVLNFIDDWKDVFAGKQAQFAALPATEKQCEELKDLLTSAKSYLQFKRGGFWDGILDADTKYQDLIDGLDKKKYNTNDKFRQKIQLLAERITEACSTRNPTSRREFMEQAHLTKAPNFSLISDIDGTGWKVPVVNKDKLNDFKAQYKVLFSTLYNDKKVFEAFKSKESEDTRISSTIEGVKTSLDYDKPDSANYLVPKHDEQLKIRQQIRRWTADTYENCFSKYVELKGDRLFYSEPARKIYNALDRAGVKPQDGIKGIIDGGKGDKSGMVGKILKESQGASAHYKWLVDTLKTFNSDPEMSKTVSGALKNGRQMRKLIAELIATAVEQNKIEEAKTAMEVLSVMKYGLTTSRLLDTMRAQKKTAVLSDTNLSWNKNEGVRMVMTALEEGIRFAVKTVFLVATVPANAISLAGSKFNHTYKHGKKDRAGQKLQTMSERFKSAPENDKGAFEAQKASLDADADTRIEAAKADREYALSKLSIVESDEEKLESAVNEQERTVQETLRANLANVSVDLQVLQEEDETYKELLLLVKKRDRLLSVITKLDQKLRQQKELAEKRALVETLEAKLRANVYDDEVKTTLEKLKGKLRAEGNAAAETIVETLKTTLQEKQKKIEEAKKPQKEEAATGNAEAGTETPQPAPLPTPEIEPDFFSDAEPVIQSLKTQLHLNAPAQDLESEKEELKQSLTGKRGVDEAILGYEGRYPYLTKDNLETMSSIDLGNFITNFEQNGSAYAKAIADYDKINGDLEDNRDAVQRFRDAQKNIKALEKAKADRDKKLANWDKDHLNKVEYLVKYWDMLEKGRTFHTGHAYSWTPGSKKKKQEKFNETSPKYIMDFMSNYSMSA